MAQNFKIFVLCGGKSGSSTLHSTFINNGFKSLKIHSKLDYIEQFNCDKFEKNYIIRGNCKTNL